MPKIRHNRRARSQHFHTNNTPLETGKTSQSSSIFDIGKRFSQHWQNIPTGAKIAFYGLTGFCAFQALTPNPASFMNAVVCTPIIEEILYRGLLTEGIRFAQSLYNGAYKKEGLSEEEQKTQDSFRVNLVAGIFGLEHRHLSVEQVGFHYWYQGRALGYLKEETGSLFAPFALHAAHNLIALVRYRFFWPPTVLSDILLSYPLLYLPVFIALNKKYLPIPDEMIPTFMKDTSAKIRDFFSRSKSVYA